MELIKWKLSKITDAWNHYFWDHKSLQDKINFNSEVKTNYYGEILSYFNDTFGLLKINPEDKFSNNIFHYNGLLQIMYVHQDLMDELLHIFKLQKSSLSAKAPIREIRNELIGHPIRRNKSGNELISSVLFSNSTSNTKLQYLKYDKVNGFKMKIVTYDTQSILDIHGQFLNEYFDIILSKICTLLTRYSKRLKEFENSLLLDIEFKKVIRQVEISFESILKISHLYKKEHLLGCFIRQNEHQRYRNAIEMFLADLKISLSESQLNIEDFIKEIKNNTPPVYTNISISQSLEVFVDLKSPKKIAKKDFTYELGKLHERHPIFTIEYFKKEFKEYDIIIAELENMDLHFHNNLEYYSSYEYLRKLILGI